MAWDKLIHREDTQEMMLKAQIKSLSAEYRDCHVNVQYVAKYDRLYLSDFSCDGTLATFMNGERIL